MDLRLNLKKTVEQNAADYFERAKKLKAKAKGAEEAIARLSTQIARLEKETAKQTAAQPPKAPQSPRKSIEWFEKFRWFISSEGFLVVGGRDAVTNEIVIKKHTSPNDIVFHTEAPGSPFFVIKTEGKPTGESTLVETAIATASFSRAWKLGLAVSDVFWVKPDQLSKTAESGEFVPKGAFVVRGRKNILRVPLGLFVGMARDGKIMCAAESAIRANCDLFVKLQQGSSKSSDCAKRIQRVIKGELDAIQRVLPAGGCSVESE